MLSGYIRKLGFTNLEKGITMSVVASEVKLDHKSFDSMGSISGPLTDWSTMRGMGPTIVGSQS